MDQVRRATIKSWTSLKFGSIRLLSTRLTIQYFQTSILSTTWVSLSFQRQEETFMGWINGLSQKLMWKLLFKRSIDRKTYQVYASFPGLSKSIHSLCQILANLIILLKDKCKLKELNLIRAFKCLCRPKTGKIPDIYFKWKTAYNFTLSPSAILEHSTLLPKCIHGLTQSRLSK